jgi:hypothetical protein
MLHFFSCRADKQAHADDFLQELRARDSAVKLKSYHLNSIFDLPERAVEVAADLSLDQIIRVAGRVAGGATIVATLRDCPLVVNPLVLGEGCVV